MNSDRCIGAKDGISGCNICCDMDKSCVNTCMKGSGPRILPKLKSIDYSKKKHKYRLTDGTRKRRMAMNEGVSSEAKKKGTRKAAIAKKGRLNILRIYRRNNKPKECNIITKDMRYLDKKYKLNKTKNICKKQKGGNKNKNIFNEKLEVCSTDPVTGYRRDGYCATDETDSGSHLVCAKMDKKFLDFTANKGNDLRSVVKEGDKWCLCQERWLEAHDENKAPKVIKRATNKKTRKKVKNLILQQKAGKRKTQKKEFLFNPDDPKKSFDVYIDKDPDDTIPIKYTTVKDVEDTIKKLERLYKTKKYTHKRIWQVGMIMKVRLGAMKKHKKEKYPNAKNVEARYNLANKYFKFLGERSKVDGFNKRKAMTFQV